MLMTGCFVNLEPGLERSKVETGNPARQRLRHCGVIKFKGFAVGFLIVILPQNVNESISVIVNHSEIVNLVFPSPVLYYRIGKRGRQILYDTIFSK